jgi:predicted transposase YdaD
LAILANFEKDGEDLALRNILKGVQACDKGDFSESRYLEQLRILAQLRRLDIKFIEIMESITKFFKEEKDPLFQRGETKGEARGRQDEAISIAIEMKKEGIPFDQIAKFTKLSVEEIEKL